MIIKYRINDIGIYVDEDTSKWYKFISHDLQKQLDGYQVSQESKGIKQKLVFKDFDKLNINSLREGLVVPESSVYSNGLFIELELKLALKEEKNELHCWIKSDTLFLSLPFLIHILLRQNGQMFVHGAGVAKDGKGILVAAFGGIGKTSFISKAIDVDGVTVLGDDLVIVDRDGNLSPYMRPFCLYPYHKSLFPEYFKKNKIKYKRINLFNRVIARIKRELKIKDDSIFSYKTVAPSKLIPLNCIQQDKVKLDKVYILKRVKEVTEIKVSENYSRQKAVDFTVDVILHEWYMFAKMTFNLLAQRDESVIDYFSYYKDVISNSVNKANSVTLVLIPENMGANEVAENLTEILLK